MDDNWGFLAFIATLIFIFGLLMGEITNSNSISKDCETLKQFRLGNTAYSCELGKK